MANSKKAAPYVYPMNLDADRPELVNPKETEQDHYRPDTIADPEGARIRDNVKYLGFPKFVLDNFYDDTKNLWGKPNKSNAQMLRPTDVHINECIKFSIITDEDDVAMNRMAYGTHGDAITQVRDAYITILDTIESTMHFEIMKQVANITTNMLAKRAIAKATYNAATGRVTESHESVPDYIENLQTRMFEASANAGMWRAIHADLWTHLNWQKAPLYYVDNAIKMDLHQKAAYFDKTYRPVAPATATVDDLKKFTIAC